MTNVEASLSMLKNANILLYIGKGVLFTMIISVIAVLSGIISYLYRSVQKYAAFALDIHMPCVLPVSLALFKEAVWTHKRGDKAFV